ncbi:hypothetical protein ALT_2540 [Aspergillus lentulus]|uniref:Protein kinase domain-containing protein n=1 Tax=Aspergillus lentulus TaxID=293939 RepID=A0AAN4PEI4_ASPLE|nr:hypothetical protein ALT_2540 [Aspergillus lentulus]
MAYTPLLQKGTKLIGESGRTYILIAHLVQLAIPNVWKAHQWGNEKEQFVIKHPQSDGSPEKRWPAFRKEMEMQRLFQPAKFIRKMVDVIPARSDMEPTMMVLEPFEKTLWSARTRRPLTTREIKHIMKLALLGLPEVHEKGLVYCDFKMENVLRNGFDDSDPASDDVTIPLRINVKLADLGSVMAPDRGEVTSITYRSPEVYFGKAWTSAVDIWAWGIAYFQLLQAQIDSNSPGMYDSVIKEGTLEQKAEMVRACQCHDFDLRSVEYFQDCDFSAVDDQGVKGGLNSGDEHWTDRLVALGIPEYDVVFLYAVLQPDATKRMTVDQILETGYLDVY